MSSKEYQRVGEKYCITVTINQLPVKFSTIPPFFIPDHPGVSFSLLPVLFNIFYPKIIFKLLNTLWLQIHSFIGHWNRCHPSSWKKHAFLPEIIVFDCIT